MRPAYRYGLAAGVATLIAVLLVLWLAIPESVDPTAPPTVQVDEDHVRQPVRPEGLEPVETPIIGDPGKATRADLLDDIEVFETERFGAAEAGRRRRAREQLLDGRMEQLKKDEP